MEKADKNKDELTSWIQILDKAGYEITEKGEE